MWATAISADTRDGHEMLRRLLQPPRSLCASTGHYPRLPSWEPVQPATARVPWSRDNFPRRTHGAPQAVAMSHWPLPPQACAAFYTPLSPGLSEPEPPNQPSFNPLLCGWRTDARVRPTCRGRAKSKAETQELCRQREREISLCSLRSSRLNLHNQLMYPASVECLIRQRIIPKLRWWTLGATVDFGFAVCDWLVSDFYV